MMRAERCEISAGAGDRQYPRCRPEAFGACLASARNCSEKKASHPRIQGKSEKCNNNEDLFGEKN
eukprot:369573-Amphidinium_carterae.1